MEFSSYRNPYALFLFLLSACCIIYSSDAILCITLFEDTWDGFIRALQFAHRGVAVLCPFTIQGRGCPTEEDHYNFGTYELQAGMQLYILCYSFYGGYEERCVIDCPGTHFVVPPYARLELDRFTFQGSSDGAAIQVKPYGELALYNAILQNNGNFNTNGGAINAEQFSIVSLYDCHFESNTANSGGALYTRGYSEIEDSSFIDNRATSLYEDEGGGAIYFGQGATADLINSIFRGNEANYVGPALLDRSSSHGNGITIKENSACHNQVTTTGYECNGKQLFSQQMGSGGLSSRFASSITGGPCLQFENACESSSNTGANVPPVMDRSSPRDYEDPGPPPIVDVPRAASCSAHPKCFGLHGNCCPTPAGIRLYCCE